MEENKQTKKSQNEITIKDIVMTLAIAIAMSFFLSSFFRLTVVNGHSMDSTLHDGQRLVLNLKAYAKEEPDYKDIVVIEREDLSVQFLIKRVIGTPGDKVTIKDNQLYINDELIKEDYINEDMMTDDLEIFVPEDKVFVMGDNRNHSVDSRSVVIGLIDIDDIVGKAVFSITGFKAVE